MSDRFVAKALLFDQLTEQSEFLTEGQSPDVSLLLTESALKKSVQKELEALFNTRSSLTSTEMDRLIAENSDETLLAGIEGFLGLPSLPSVFAEGTHDWLAFQEKCALMIRLYEPRLENPSVEVKAFDPQRQCLHFQIQAALVMRDRRENVAFELAVGAEDSSAT